MIIDSHGHYTTAPAGVQIFRATQITFMGAPVKHPVNVTDDQIRASLENGQLRLQNERGTDVALFSPRASWMGHHFGGELISRYWTEINNDLIKRVCDIYPDRFIPVASLPQSPGVPPERGRRAGVGTSRERDGVRGVQPQPRPIRRLVDGSAVGRPLLVPALREDGGVGTYRR